MRRFATFFTISLVVLICISTVSAKFTRGDRVKLRRMLSNYLSLTVDDDKRYEAQKDFTAFFSGKKKKELKSVDDLMGILAGSGERPKQRKGVLLKQIKLSERSSETFKYAISVPKKYSGNLDSKSWPFILALPPKGMSAAKYLDTYWKDETIRASYLIAALDFNYRDIEVSVVKEVEEDGKTKLQTVKEKRPFTWDSTFALARFWRALYLIQMRDFKVDPNRIILDGAGEGTDGILDFGVCAAWRFAGMVARGGKVSDASIANLKDLRMLSLPHDGAAEESKKAHQSLAASLGENYTAGDAAMAADGVQLKAWLDATTRARFPNPSHWVVERPAQQFGYWCFVSKWHDMEKAAEITISADKRKKRVDVASKNVGEFTLYLNDVLVDMDKHFDLYVNGEKVAEKVTLERSAGQILKHAVRNGGVFTAVMEDLQIAAPVVEEKDDDKKGDDKKKDGK